MRRFNPLIKHGEHHIYWKQDRNWYRYQQEHLCDLKQQRHRVLNDLIWWWWLASSYKHLEPFLRMIYHQWLIQDKEVWSLYLDLQLFLQLNQVHEHRICYQLNRINWNQCLVMLMNNLKWLIRKHQIMKWKQLNLV